MSGTSTTPLLSSLSGAAKAKFRSYSAAVVDSCRSSCAVTGWGLYELMGIRREKNNAELSRFRVLEGQNRQNDV